MVIKYVNLEALNLRTAPQISPSNRLGVLHLGQAVTPQGEPDTAGWIKVAATLAGTDQSGFVKAEIDGQPSLRDPVSASREALVSIVIQQWLRFERGLGQEYSDPFYKYVGEMWKAIGQNLDGKDRDVPWSAAFISFAVRQSAQTIAKYDNFKFAAAHARYIHDAISRRNRGDNAAPYWGHRLHERAPAIGDMVGRWRETPRDYDDAEKNDSFKSHCDIIVNVRPDSVLAIGGNVGQSVSLTRYAKTGAGFLAPENGTFVHLVNMT